MRKTNTQKHLSLRLPREPLMELSKENSTTIKAKIKIKKVKVIEIPLAMLVVQHRRNASKIFANNLLQIIKAPIVSSARKTHVLNILKISFRVNSNQSCVEFFKLWIQFHLRWPIVQTSYC